MSQAGRLPVPTWLRELRGTLVPGERDGEPMPEAALYIPPPRDWLEGGNDPRPIAAEFWALHLPLLCKNKMITEVDMTAFSLMCVCFEEMVLAEKELKDKGKVQKTENGYQVQSPYVSIAQQRRKEFGEYVREFGLTPTARTRLRIQILGGPGDDDGREQQAEFFGF